jgi:hypothetical protein
MFITPAHSGSKFLNPFGRFGRIRSAEMRKPLWSNSTKGGKKPLAERLAFFLCDFVLETSPLAQTEDEVLTESVGLEEVLHINCGGDEDS